MNSYLEADYTFDYFIIRSAKNEIYNFILSEVGNTVDMRKEYVALQVYINGNSYQFTTNNITKYLEILDNKYNELKDTDEYKEYNQTNTEESVEYYD